MLNINNIVKELMVLSKNIKDAEQRLALAKKEQKELIDKRIKLTREIKRFTPISRAIDNELKEEPKIKEEKRKLRESLALLNVRIIEVEEVNAQLTEVNTQLTQLLATISEKEYSSSVSDDENDDKSSESSEKSHIDRARQFKARPKKDRVKPK